MTAKRTTRRRERTKGPRGPFSVSKIAIDEAAEKCYYYGVMSDKKFENFSVTPKRPDTVPTIDEAGVVSGEIGSPEAPALPPEEIALRAIEGDARKDGQLAQAFADAEGDAAERAGAVLDRINEMRRDLDRSDSDPDFKRERDLWLSRIANRLRELL